MGKLKNVDLTNPPVNGNTLVFNSTTGLWTPGAAGTAFLGARAYRTTTQAVATATITAVQLDAEVFDTSGIHEGVTNPSRFKAPAGMAGYWGFTGTGSWQANATGQRELFWRKNGATIQPGSNAHLSSGASLGVYMNAPTLVALLAVDDYIELMAYQASGATLNLNATDTTVTAWFLGAA